MKPLTAIFFLLHFALFAGATVIHVGKGFPVQQIQAAIRQAKNGDTVMVHGGWYKEGNLLIDKPLVLLGINRPVLDGQKKFEVVSIKADRVVLDGFRIQGSGYATLEDPCAIKVYDSNESDLE